MAGARDQQRPCGFACDYGPHWLNGGGGEYAGPCDYGCNQPQPAPKQCVKCCFDLDEDADNLTPACDGSIPVRQFYGAKIIPRNGDPNPLTVG